MLEISLQNTPNQSFSLDTEGVVFDITISTTGVTVMDVVIDGVLKIGSAKCLPMTPVIPYRYLEHGNFFFITENDEYPDYTKFGISQRLVYMTPSEMEAFYGS